MGKNPFFKIVFICTVSQQICYGISNTFYSNCGIIFYTPLSLIFTVSGRHYNVIVASRYKESEVYTISSDRRDALKKFPAMLQDILLNGPFFPLLFDGDKELEGLAKRIPKIDVKELYDDAMIL